MKKFIFFVLMALLIITPLVAALTALTVTWTLPRETFRPGSDATISLVFTNSGTDDLTNVVATPSGSNYVSVTSGKIEFGGMKATTTNQAELSIKIKDDAPSSTSAIYLKVDYYTGTASFAKTLSIPITIRREPTFEIQNVQFDSELSPGKTIKLTFDLVNSGVGPAKEVKVALDDTDELFVTTGSSGEVSVAEIAGGTRQTIEYTITLDPDADIGIINIPVKLEYYDETNSNLYEETKYIGAKLLGDIDLVATIDSTENFYRGSIGKISISIANRGTAPAEYTTVYAKSEYGESEFYIGSIDPDDYETIELSQELKGFASKYPIELNITYKDKFNEEYTVQKTVYASATSAPVNMTAIIIIIIVIGAAYWHYRKKHSKK